MLSVNPIDDFQTPAFEKRSLWLRSHDRSIIRYAWRLDGREVVNGHNLGRLVPVKEYPQYYDPDNPGNPSMTHPEGIGIIVEKFRKQLDESTAPPDYRVPLSLTPADTDRFYRHPDAPKVGNISAELMYMTNAVARELQKSHPNRFLIGNLAYWVTHGPPRPMIRAEAGVTLMIVNEGNHTKPLEYPIVHKRRHPGRSNHRVNTNFRHWQEPGAMEGIYEWWLPGINGNIWGKLPGSRCIRRRRTWNSGTARASNTCFTKPGPRRSPISSHCAGPPITSRPAACGMWASRTKKS